MTSTPPDHETVGTVAVHVGTPKLLVETDRGAVWSGIVKAPVPDGTVVWLSTVNLAGDGQADLSVHGGPDKAVYAYPSEHLGPWSTELGERLDPAAFGENLTTLGVTEADTCIGDVWAWDEALLEVCQPRWPCFKLVLHLGRADVQHRMRATGRTGWYLRVLEPGAVTVGHDLSVVHRHPARLSVLDAHLAMGDRHVEDPARLEALAGHDRLAAQWRDPLRGRLIGQT